MSFMDCYKENRKLHTAAYSLRACMSRKTLPKPTSMRELIHRQTGCARSNIHIGDAHFDPITSGLMETFLAQDETDLQEYVAGGHDCENFALRLQYFAHEYFFKKDLNAAFCEIWGPILMQGKIVQHGFNGFVAPDMVLRLIEPQTDGIYVVKDYLRGRPALVIMR